MDVTTSIWAHDRFGGTLIKEVQFPFGDSFNIKQDSYQLRIHFGNEQEALNFKNQVLWAWEAHLRSKKHA